MKIGLIGTGLLGKPIGEIYLKEGYDLTVYNRSIEKTEPLAAAGAEVAPRPEEVIEKSDLVLTVVSDYSSVCEVLFTNVSDFKDKTVIQISTILPSESQLLSKRISEMGGDLIEAPVLGSIKQVLSGSLILLISCDRMLFDKWSNFFGPVSNKIVYLGDYGSASLTKLALNQLIANLTVSFASSLGLLVENRIDVDKFMEILRGSALYAPTFDKKISNMLDREFGNPNFPVKHLLKDMNLIIQAAKSTGLNTKSLESTREILVEAVESKLGELDYSALYNIVNPKKIDQ
jgi:3-hydroxyisobutyrate dehydrogenase